MVRIKGISKLFFLACLEEIVLGPVCLQFLLPLRYATLYNLLLNDLRHGLLNIRVDTSNVFLTQGLPLPSFLNHLLSNRFLALSDDRRETCLIGISVRQLPI